MYVLIAGATALALLAVLGIWILGTRRRRFEEAALQVEVHAFASSPNRDLAATLPHRSEESARLDRSVGYERARKARLRSDVDEELADQLRPTQVIRVGDTAERDALSEGVPDHIKAIFVKEEAPAKGTTVALPGDRDSEEQRKR